MPNTFVYINSTSLSVKVRACSVKTQDVSLPQVVAQSLKSVGDESTVAKSFSVSLQCDPDVVVHAGMSDALNTGNRSNTLSISGEAKGVGVRLYRDGVSQPVSYGPDTSAIGNYSHRWLVGNTGGGTRFELPFVAKYVRTSQNVVAGTFAARAVITFSYQ